ncbi:hypothetical protein AVEN_122957-1 [Araneus ventricosus]|uniref:Uncharacterized protein n=1 Tax=Araneus ventricosus TaxID=182803 RepID=A0A4Y2PZZ1_ARAVE|nr:hypothetical protein AVEN_122957-1 [Araneus ventricosus]
MNWKLSKLFSKAAACDPFFDGSLILNFEKWGGGAESLAGNGTISRRAAYVQKAEIEDPDIKPILERKRKLTDRPSRQEITPESLATKRYWAIWDSLHLKDGSFIVSGRMMMEAHSMATNSPEEQNSRSSARHS